MFNTKIYNWSKCKDHVPRNFSATESTIISCRSSTGSGAIMKAGEGQKEFKENQRRIIPSGQDNCTPELVKAVLA